MLSHGYLGLGLLGLLGFGWVLATGYELGSPSRTRLPPEARGAAGYRSFHFWHSGYHGGK